MLLRELTFVNKAEFRLKVDVLFVILRNYWVMRCLVFELVLNKSYQLLNICHVTNYYFTSNFLTYPNSIN